MILIIDTTKKECQVTLREGDKTTEIKWLWQKDTGGEALENITKLLGKVGKKLEDIKAILVNIGPGSFTGTRVGVTIGNTLAWSLNIPVFSYQSDQKEKMLKEISKSKISGFSKIVLPSYD